MNKNLSLTLACIFVFGMFFICRAQTTKSITVTGLVTDSLTKDSISGAMVLLYATSDTSLDRNNLGSLKLDTAFTGTNGKFQHQMTIDAQAIFLVYAVFKQGYYIKSPSVPSFIIFSTVTLPPIKISKIDNSVRDTLTVSGIVKDSSTGIGINGARVIMTTGGAFDTIGNTTFTGADGSFSKQVIISKLNGASVVSYIITDQNYQTKLGQNTATGKQLDVGSILLKSTNVAIRPTGINITRAQANRMSVYAINGRLLYAGRILPLDKLAQGQAGEVIVKLTKENTIIGMKKYVPALK